MLVQNSLYDPTLYSFLEARILRLLIAHARKYREHFYGLAVKNIYRFLDLHPNRKTISEVNQALRNLERDGLVFSRSNPNRRRWFATPQAIAAHISLEQRSIEEFM